MTLENKSNFAMNQGYLQETSSGTWFPNMKWCQESEESIACLKEAWGFQDSKGKIRLI